MGWNGSNGQWEYKKSVRKLLSEQYLFISFVTLLFGPRVIISSGQGAIVMIGSTFRQTGWNGQPKKFFSLAGIRTPIFVRDTETH